MLPKYFWIFFVVSIIYLLYSNNYYVHLKDFVINYYHKNLVTTNPEKIQNDGEILFTKSVLKKYSNLQNGLYLAILGQVFDVTSGVKHYGPGETYHVFTGRDASAAFITGEFTDSGLTDDISTLTNKQIQSLVNWVEFYRKTYVYKGKLIGRYYDKQGLPTNENAKLEERLQLIKKSNAQEEEFKIKFPPCNSEWTEKSGTRVWCSKNSGGISRNWVGVPRMIYEKPESKHERCACINLESTNYEEFKSLIRVIEGCSDNSVSCSIKKIDS